MRQPWRIPTSSKPAERLTGFEKNDKTDLLNVLADDVVFEFSDSLPYGGTYNGKAEFQTFWKHVFQEYDYFNYDAHAILEADDYVIVPVIARAKTKLLHGERASVPVPRPEREDCLWTHLCRYRARARDVLDGREPRRFPKLQLSRPRCAAAMFLTTAAGGTRSPASTGNT
jgi:hypothetical protein